MFAASAWFVGGLYIDGWAHFHLKSASESFFTPWHAIFYSGFLACALLLASAMAANHSRGFPWNRSLPAGYDTSLIGVLVFGVAGAGDMLWHIYFGIETDVATQLSPTHLLLAVGMVLIAAGPFCAAARQPVPPAQSVRAQLPSLLSLGLVLAILSLFSKAFHPFYIPWEAGIWAPSAGYSAALLARISYLQEALGMAGIFIQSAILVALLLIALRKRLLPPGAITLILGIDTLLFDVALLPVSLLSGTIGDVLLWRLRPSPQHLLAVRILAVSLPVCLCALYHVEIALTRGGIWWPAHLVAGSLVLSGLSGLLVSYLVFPPYDATASGSESAILSQDDTSAPERLV